MTRFAHLDDTVQAINRGQVFRIILKPWRTDELILILKSAAHAFRLERSHEKLLLDLRRLNGELEERVQQRTAELEEAVLQLQQRNSMLEKLSLTDALTGLPNRRAIDRVAEAELRRRQRHPGPLALGVLDADHFKAINTRYLLPGGDQVLVNLARILRSVVRAEDTVGRIGGEEFLVLAPETHLEGATSLAERLRSAVERGSTSHNGEMIRATVSGGFVVASPAVTATYAQMKDAASAALAEAKATGRNRCVVRSL
jgi:diguanylate cyclase (GGDEF)-like protein